MELGALLDGKRVLIVPRGASDVAAMCAWIFETAGLEPGFRLERPAANLGGVALRPASTRRRLLLGGSAPPPPFVLEGALAELRSIGDVRASGAIISGDDDDATLAEALAHIDPDALVACAAGAPRARSLAARCPRTAFYGLDTDDSGEVTPTWLGALAPFDDASGAQPFDLFAGGSYCGRFALRGSGARAVRDAVGAIAICAEGFGVDVEKTRQALMTFEVAR